MPLLQPLSRDECHQVADLIGDTPQTTIEVHMLRRGLCNAYRIVQGDRIGGVIQSFDQSGEPSGFGNDPGLIWSVLQTIKGWDCINVMLETAQPLTDLMGVPVRFYSSVDYALNQPVIPYRHDAVRMMTMDDLDLLRNAPDDVRPTGFGSLENLLLEGYVACGVMDGQVIAAALTYARTNHYADVGVTTLPEWRNQGISSAAASLVMQRVQADGQIPVWSTGEDNWASMRVAQKLGLKEVFRRVYLIPQRQL